MTLLEEAQGLLDDAVELRRRIHRHPEVGLDLPRTQEAVVEALDGLGYQVRLGTKCSSVVATLDGGHPGPTVLLRGDMDALPMREDTGLPFASEVDGAMHACGHDAHTAMLAGAARLLASHRDELRGRVLLMFQPGEEGYFGARVMIEEGLLDAEAEGDGTGGAKAPSAAFAIHQSAHEPAGRVRSRGGPLAASSNAIRIQIQGRGGHASAPYMALDPIPAACEITLALQTMVTRRISVFAPAVVTVAHIEAGTTNNVIPASALLEGTVRALAETTRTRVLEQIQQVVDGVSAAHGVQGSLTVLEGYPATVNDHAMADFALEVARGVVGEADVSPMPDPVMGAEDFSYVLQRVPGAMVRLGLAPPGVEAPAPNHSNRMTIHEPGMAVGIALYAAWALRYAARP